MKFKIERNPEYLEHHGIEGQRWGYMNGPPYPLDYESHSAVEKRLNPRSELDNYINESSSRAKDFARRHKKALIIGGVILTTVMMQKAEKRVKKDYVDKITPYWSEKSGPHSKLGKRYIEGLEKDLYKMKVSDLASEAKFVKKNDWSRLSFDGKHWR